MAGFPSLLLYSEKEASGGLDLSGGSRVVLTGSADDLVVKGSGGSQLDLETFSVANADVNLSGGSKVIYIGEPTLGDINLSGDSTLSKK